MSNYIYCSSVTSRSICDGLPVGLQNYLKHVVEGRSIRSIARAEACSASTVLRRIRKIESRRDDPLVDEALDALAALLAATQPEQQLELCLMPNTATPTIETSEDTIKREARRILRRLCEKDAFLLVSPSMEFAAVFKELVPGKMTRIARVNREVARVFALNEWMQTRSNGNISKYYITPVGRTALKRLIVEEKKTRETKNTAFQEQHQVFGERTVRDYTSGKAETVRYNLAESPLSLLAKKKDKNGVEYLSPDLLEAGERLREDFERAHLGARVAQNWERFLTGVSTPIGSATSGGSDVSRQRVVDALHNLGPGLGDIVLRVCCFLEGLEKAEKRLGWSARSGKVVLRIALVRLADFYGITSMEEYREAS